MIEKINRNSAEGQLLIAAMAVITTESRTNQTPGQVLQHLQDLQTFIYSDPDDFVALGTQPFEKTIGDKNERIAKLEAENEILKHNEKVLANDVKSLVAEQEKWRTVSENLLHEKNSIVDKHRKLTELVEGDAENVIKWIHGLEAIPKDETISRFQTIAAFKKMVDRVEKLDAKVQELRAENERWAEKFAELQTERNALAEDCKFYKTKI